MAAEPGTGPNAKTGPVCLLAACLGLAKKQQGFAVGSMVGIQGPGWLRLLAGLATTAMLTVLVGLGTKGGRGPVARLANWMIRG